MLLKHGIEFNSGQIMQKEKDPTEVGFKSAWCQIKQLMVGHRSHARLGRIKAHP